MKRRFPVLVIVMVVAMATGSAIFAYREASLTSKRSRTTTSVTTFTNAIQHANDARFVATYRLRSYLFFSSGTIVIALIPSPPGMRATTNADGYSGSGRYAYLFRGSTGRIIQWIKIGTNVSACVNVLVAGNFENGTFGKLRCSRPSPYVPSNGFAEPDAGFVPTYVRQQVTSMAAVPSRERALVTSRSSRAFGPLRCLAQFSGPTRQTTCIDRAGFVVTWLLQTGSRYSSSATLTSINRHPAPADFTTLLHPTTALILPAT